VLLGGAPGLNVSFGTNTTGSGAPLHAGVTAASVVLQRDADADAELPLGPEDAPRRVVDVLLAPGRVVLHVPVCCFPQPEGASSSTPTTRRMLVELPRASSEHPLLLGMHNCAVVCVKLATLTSEQLGV